MQKEFSEAVPKWDSIIHKNVRTADGEPLGYIAADDDESIFILSSRFREYRIPKSHVQSFDGSTVVLDVDYLALQHYKVG